VRSPGPGCSAQGIAAWLTPRALLTVASIAGMLFLGLVWALVSTDAAIFPTVVRLADWGMAAARHPATLVMPLLVGGGIGGWLYARGLAKLALAKR
jgi:hypothetical protein